MSAPTIAPDLYIGLMSGTSLDGVDAVLASFSRTEMRTLGTAHVAFPEALRSALMALQYPAENEIHREALAANNLARIYADCVTQLLRASSMKADDVKAIGVHGQTIRHQPAMGYTRQTNNPALLAELTGIDVIADFRSRDIAAGGQGAPLVPAFHHAVFGAQGETRVVSNIGGISNISVLQADGRITGFDTGPGNVLMDIWIGKMKGQRYDDNGNWAKSGKICRPLLTRLLAEPFLALPAPKSTGRDLFHPAWLAERLRSFEAISPPDVQATLAAYTAVTLADAIARYAPTAEAVYICGGGAFNIALLEQIALALANHNHPAKLHSTDTLGISPNHVEAFAFAWLAYRFSNRQSGNLPAVTGANGPRILGALYPA